MKILSINIGEPREIEYRDRPVVTGIYKEPMRGPIPLEKLGLAGDVQVDRENHGGADKAVYVYSIENYRFWEADLGRTGLPHGQFGENLTVEGMPDESVHIGDVFRMGNATVQVTQPRVPCYKLGVKMGDAGFVAQFLRSGRVGFYLRVLAEGAINQGDAIESLERDPRAVDIRESMRAMVDGPHQRAVIERVLEVPALSEAWRDSLSKRLTRIG